MTWDELLARDWIGCDCESQEGGVYYRGPVERIERVDADVVWVHLKWCARLEPGKTWEFFRSDGLGLNMKEVAPPQDIGEGRVMVMLPLVGPTVFFPKTVSRLNPAKVAGLPPEFAEPDFVDPKD